jgi:hypothetical protein
MAQQFIETVTLEQLAFIINGGVMGGVSVVTVAGKVMDLHNKTLVVSSTTVTFSDPTGQGLTYAQIKAAIEGAVASSTVKFIEGHIAVSHASGVTVGGTGTANAKFGFPTKDVVGVVYNPPDGAAPRVINVGGGARGDSYYAHVEVT